MPAVVLRGLARGGVARLVACRIQAPEFAVAHEHLASDLDGALGSAAEGNAAQLPGHVSQEERSMRDIPQRFADFIENYPEIARAYEQLGTACHLAGPIGKKERALLKLGISMGAWLEGAVHSHVRKSLEAGATHEEIRHVALIALPTLGFPATKAVLTWVEDILPETRQKPKRKAMPGKKKR